MINIAKFETFFERLGLTLSRPLVGRGHSRTQGNVLLPNNVVLCTVRIEHSRMVITGAGPTIPKGQNRAWGEHPMEQDTTIDLTTWDWHAKFEEAIRGRMAHHAAQMAEHAANPT